MTLFLRNACLDRIIIVSLQCVFHSIRFKVNKGLGPSGDPFFLLLSHLKASKKALRQRFFFFLEEEDLPNRLP